MPRAIERLRIIDDLGFTLIEAMVAFIVLATLLSVMFRGVVQNRAGASAFALHLREDLLARTVIDQILARRDLKASTYRGEVRGHAWLAKVTRAAIPAPKKPERPQPGGAQPASQPSAADPQKAAAATWIPYRLDVRIEDGERDIRFETIHLAKAPPQGPNP